MANAKSNPNSKESVSKDDKKGVRIDRWLWSSRFFKTRGLAAAAVKNGRVLLNDDRPKVSKLVHLGDQLTVRRDAFRYEVEVTGLAERRVSAVAARELYQESESSQKARAELAERLKHSSFDRTPGRPTKRQRRELDKFRRDSG